MGNLPVEKSSGKIWWTAIPNLIQYGHPECHSGLHIGIVLLLEGCTRVTMQTLLPDGTCLEKCPGKKACAQMGLASGESMKGTWV